MHRGRFQRVALARLIMVGCAAFFGTCVCAYSQLPGQFVPPPPPPVFNPSTPYTVPQPSYTPVSPGLPNAAPGAGVFSPSYERPPTAVARAHQRVAREGRSGHRHRRQSLTRRSYSAAADYHHPLDYVVSDDAPVLDVNPVCRGIAAQAANPTEKGGPDTSFKDCVSSEQEVRGELAKAWSTFTLADKGHCVRLSKTGGLSSYTELLTCLEMARDVRKLR